ncbi:MAG: UDP-N-acetylglucosamine 2-epimerase (hydrolyzing) [Rhodospirillales bacterium]|nr:UDP-N-acetylglucosamine 2-epimerase (hydrolyzing) [Rhodospirillales bacterium]MBO6787744.1 UDP-N-acetylglucosamine 2-epimerase (hydrolyzing) [Rhodospirillales bacterium]
MTSPRKICVVTGTRADYGLLYWLMKEIDADPALELQLVVTGTHLEPRFGNTVDVIENDGFRVDTRVPLGIEDDTPTAISNATGKALAGIGAAFASLGPDAGVLIGDRYEILAAATAALLHRVPFAHIHGGEVTEGAVDDSMRHAITKMAAWHFAAAEPYRQRIIQMGEAPDKVVTVGAPGLDHIERTPLLDRAETADVLGIDADTPYFLITMHPTTLSAGDPLTEITALLDALDRVKDHALIFTGVNADAGHDRIAGTVHAYVDANAERARLFMSLGQQRYLSAMKHAAAVIGNSSSGIIEAPAFGVPTVNIGIRQQGRLRARSVIDCGTDASGIEDAIGRATDPAFRSSFSGSEPPYGHPGASVRMKDFLVHCDFGNAGRKSFHDLPDIMSAP